ncbi:MAG TPA: hypothetical protein ENG83_13230 [Nitrospirae bacterium]|nr:hypothetical protein BMS3Abin06_01815 [bacterium BMS3Abin06]HDH13138.1 hypothetical protein [Nitrospirota bacterium]HDZ03306.1 hypothetical protein [Nitrospirota bacterium]
MSAKTVGFDRELKLKWLDATADLLLEGLTGKDILARLNAILDGELSDGGTRGAKGKTITVLLHIWVKVPDIAKPLRNDAINLLHRPDTNRLILHWGLCLATYPFFAFVAGTIGRLAKLQGAFSSIHVQRRAKEQYGERETVSRAVNRIIQSLRDWKVIKENSEERIFEIEKPLPVKNSLLTGWLIESALISTGNKSALLKAVTHSPALFPFDIALPDSRMLEESNRLELFHHGLDEVISLPRISF